MKKFTQTSDPSRFSYFNAERDKEYIRRAVEVSRKSREGGNNPFGSILVYRDGTVLLEQGNIEVTEKDPTGHAETSLVRKASKIYDKNFLWDCTLYSTAEPCVMCMGAIYWGNIGRVVYGITEAKLLELTGSDEKNPTFDIPSEVVVNGGQKEILLLNYSEDDELAAEIIKVHEGFWNKG